MQNRSGIKDSIRSFTNFITFIDLPIREKFLLFAIGVLFWFVAMFTVIQVAMHDLKTRSDTIVTRVVPQERAAQVIVSHLQKVIIDCTDLVRLTNPAGIIQKLEKSSHNLSTVTSLLGTLTERDAVAARTPDNRSFTKFFIPVANANEMEADRFLAELAPLIVTANKQFQSLAATKLADFAASADNAEDIGIKLDELRQTLDRSIQLSSQLAERIGGLYSVKTDGISNSIHLATTAAGGVLAIATLLLVIFTFWISRSIARPVTCMTEQIKLLSRGEMDVSRKITISSKDEIGILSTEFNGLMESIFSMKSFKKVIEEDDNLDEVYSRLGKVFVGEIGLGENYMIYEVSNSQNRMKAVQPATLTSDDLACSAEILDNCNLCKAKKTGRIVSSLEYSETCHKFNPECGKEHVCMPMMVGGSTGGVVQFLIDRQEYKENSSRVEQKLFRARQFINESISVIEAKRLLGSLRDSALTDALTGLHNRRFLQEYTEKLVAGVRRRGKNVGLIMCDLDYFKQVNDVHGHAAGDTVLKEASVVIRNSVRDSDIVIRFGGEEFLVVLLDVEKNEAEVIAEKIRVCMEKTQFKIPQGNIISKTISLGVSEYPTDTDGFWQAIKFADVALYKAKDAGRNKLIRYVEGMWSESQF